MINFNDSNYICRDLKSLSDEYKLEINKQERAIVEYQLEIDEHKLTVHEYKLGMNEYKAEILHTTFKHIENLLGPLSELFGNEEPDTDPKLLSLYLQFLELYDLISKNAEEFERLEENTLKISAADN